MRERIDLDIAARGGSLAELLAPREALPLRLKAEITGARLELAGKVILPIEREDLALELALSGERLSGLNEWLDVKLPPLGPYSFTGLLSVVKDGYDLIDLEVRVGRSDLRGSLSLTITGKRPRATAFLSADILRVDDFLVGKRPPARKGPRAASQREKQGAAAAQDALASLLSPEVMGSLDAHVSLKVGQLVSGRDRLGSGSLAATLDEGRFELTGLRFETPEGSAFLKLSLTPTASDCRWRPRPRSCASPTVPRRTVSICRRP